jgi:hypothetical protein
MTSKGWYPDPNDHQQIRWWDGSQWTEHTQPRPKTKPKENEATVNPVQTRGSKPLPVRSQKDKLSRSQWEDPVEQQRFLIEDFKARSGKESFPTGQDRRPEWLKEKIAAENAKKAKEAKKRSRTTK